MQTISPSWAVVLLGSRPFSQSTMLLLRNSGSKSIQRRRNWCASVQIMISLLMISDSKNVERFKYLGSYVNRNCNLNAEITAVFKQRQTPTTAWNCKFLIIATSLKIPKSVYTNSAYFLSFFTEVRHGLFIHVRSNNSVQSNKDTCDPF